MNPVLAKKGCMFTYGSVNKAWVTIRKGQKWEVKVLPSKLFPFYTIARHNIMLDVVEEDFKRIFEEIKNDIKR